MDFRILTEKPKQPFRYNSATVVHAYLADNVQMPYVPALKANGLYRQWIERKSEEALDEYIKHNEEMLKQGLESKALAPNFSDYQHYLYRNCLYMVEKHMRHNQDTTQLDADLENYYAVWKGRYDVAVIDWKKSQEAFQTGVEEQSDVNPYY